MSKYTKKIGSDPSYKRPKKTYQEKLTREQIVERLKGYIKVDNIMDVPLNTHLRYFQNKDGQPIFRLGGFLKRKTDAYVYLTNGTSDWCVQTDTSVFFRKQSHKEELETIKQQYDKIIIEKDAIIKKDKEIIKKLKNYIQTLEQNVPNTSLNKSKSRNTK